MRTILQQKSRIFRNKTKISGESLSFIYFNSLDLKIGCWFDVHAFCILCVHLNNLLSWPAFMFFFIWPQKQTTPFSLNSCTAKVNIPFKAYSSSVLPLYAPLFLFCLDQFLALFHYLMITSSSSHFFLSSSFLLCLAVLLRRTLQGGV